MRKIIKKYGSSYVITFSSEERKAYNLKEGTIIDMEDIVVIPLKYEKNKN